MTRPVKTTTYTKVPVAGSSLPLPAMPTLPSLASLSASLPALPSKASLAAALTSGASHFTGGGGGEGMSVSAGGAVASGSSLINSLVGSLTGSGAYSASASGDGGGGGSSYPVTDGASDGGAAAQASPGDAGSVVLGARTIIVGPDGNPIDISTLKAGDTLPIGSRIEMLD